MKKKAKPKYTGTYFGKTMQNFDSPEELEFYCWLMEAKNHGLISNIRCRPPHFDLSSRATIKFDKHLKTKIQTVDKFILHPHVYTPDFFFMITSDKISKLNIFVENPLKDSKFMIVDVKGGFSKSVDRFSVNQKWVWEKHGYYVQKIVPYEIFTGKKLIVQKPKKGAKPKKKVDPVPTWVPEMCRLSPVQRKPVKKYIGVPTINEFMEA